MPPYTVDSFFDHSYPKNCPEYWPWKEIIYIHQCPEHWQELVTLSQDQHLEFCGNFSPEWPLLDPNLLDTVSNDITQLLKRDFFAPPHEQLKNSER